MLKENAFRMFIGWSAVGLKNLDKINRTFGLFIWITINFLIA